MPADQPKRPRVAGVVVGDRLERNQRHVAEPAPGLGPHARTEPPLVDHLVPRDDPRLVLVGGSGGLEQRLDPPPGGMQPPEPPLARLVIDVTEHLVGQDPHPLTDMDLTMGQPAVDA